MRMTRARLMETDTSMKKPKVKKSRSAINGSNGHASMSLKLYVAGQSTKSLIAFANLKRVCDENCPGRYRIQVIDLLQNPKLAQGDQILALPTVVRNLPTPIRKIIGDLSNTEKLLVGLDLKAAAA
jgi:circadian clock protein KaiB